MKNLQTHRVLDLGQTFRDTVADGCRYVLPIAGCFLLYIATFWIPYINIGTTIAVTLLPVDVANRRRITPLSIFSAHYRHDIGKYVSIKEVRSDLKVATILCVAIYLFIGITYLGQRYGYIDCQWIGLITEPAFLVLLAALPFLIIGSGPLGELRYKWSPAFYYIYDRQMSPEEAQSAWSQASDDSKWRIRFSYLFLGLVSLCAIYVLAIIWMATFEQNKVVCVALTVSTFALFFSFVIAQQASIWRQLKDNYKQP